MFKFLKRHKSLGVYRNHQFYQYELQRGFSSGYAAAYVFKIYMLGLAVNIGCEKTSHHTAIEFNEYSIQFFTKKTLETIINERAKGKKHDRYLVVNLQRQLIGLRILKTRVKNEIESDFKTFLTRDK